MRISLQKRLSIKSTFKKSWAIGLLTVALPFLLLAACAPSAAIEAPVASSQLISPAEYVEEFKDSVGHILIDVRTPEEFDSGHIPGAINIPVEELPQRLDEVPQGTPIVVYCRSGNRSATAAGILTGNGYSPVYDLGGIQDWVAQGYPVQ
jgi:rhodanese-related sulfurtransferase